MRRGEQPPWIVSDGLWQRIVTLLPRTERRQRYPGRKRIPDRQVLCGILFVLYTAIPWESLPQKLGFGSGMTCWRRLAEWHAAGVWQRLHEVLLAELHAAGKLDCSKAVIDASHVRALKGDPKPVRARSTAPGPARGHPTHARQTRTARRRPERLYADRGYDYDIHRRAVRARGITPHIARRGTTHGSGLGAHR